MTTPTKEPIQIRAGVQWDWQRQDLTSLYPASQGWTLAYWFKKTGPTGANFSINATASGDYFNVSVLASATAAYAAGDYTWTAIATKATEVHEAASGKLKILPRYDTAVNLDDRSHAVKMLEAIKAVLEARASSTQREMVRYAIGGREQYFDLTESKASVLELKSKYEWLVYGENARAAVAAGQPNPNDIRVRFGRP